MAIEFEVAADDMAHCEICDVWYAPSEVDHTSVDAIPDEELDVCRHCQHIYNFDDLAADVCPRCNRSDIEQPYEHVAQFPIGDGPHIATLKVSYCEKCANDLYPETTLWADHRDKIDLFREQERRTHEHIDRLEREASEQPADAD